MNLEPRNEPWPARMAVRRSKRSADLRKKLTQFMFQIYIKYNVQLIA